MKLIKSLPTSPVRKHESGAEEDSSWRGERAESPTYVRDKKRKEEDGTALPVARQPVVKRDISSLSRRYSRLANIDRPTGADLTESTKDRNINTNISYRDKLGIRDIRHRIKPLHWKLSEGRRIWRKYKIGKFWRAVDFVNNVSKVCKREGHHPNINIEMNSGKYTVKVTFYTHKVNGITMNDIIMAAKCNSIKR